MPNIHQIVNRQINLWNAERAAFEKHRQEESSFEAEHLADLKPVVTISRERGSRGKQLAKLLSRELQYGLFDRQIIDYLSQQASLRRHVVESLDEQDRSYLELWVEGMFSMQITDHDDYIRGLIEVVKTTALQGGVVILGRGANYILSGTSAYRVRTVAPIDLRVRNLMDTEGMSEKQARDEIKKVDQDRAQYVKRYFQRDINDATGYDLVINLGSHTLDAAVKIIRSGLRARGWAVELIGGDKRGKR